MRLKWNHQKRRSPGLQEWFRSPQGGSACRGTTLGDQDFNGQRTTALSVDTLTVDPGPPLIKIPANVDQSGQPDEGEARAEPEGSRKIWSIRLLCLVSSDSLLKLHAADDGRFIVFLFALGFYQTG